MAEETENKDLPSDDELQEMLDKAEGGRKGKRNKPDPTKPSRRLPEALYYYLFILVEIVILIGVWGFMNMGTDEALKGPGFEEPITEQFWFHLKSIFVGFGDVLVGRPWLVPAVTGMALAVFVPRTPRARKRMASVVSTVIVGVFILLIALQFNEDLKNAGSMAGF